MSGKFSGFVVGLGHGGKFGGVAPASEGPAFVGDSGGGGYIGTSLDLGCGFLRVFLVELADEVGSVLKVVVRIPAMIRVIEASPLDSILDLVPVASGVEDFLYFQLLLFLDDYGRRWRLVMSWDRFGAGCGFEEADVEDWGDPDSGW